MKVRIGSAKIDENGEAHGGKAGNQTGKELAIEPFYAHPKTWFVLRAKSDNVREQIAVAMERAVKNKNIGYDQWQRNTLFKAAQDVGMDPGKVAYPVETDCSALVRVCCAFAGIVVPDFNTQTEKATLMYTKKFDYLAGDLYSGKSDNLKRGDILCTTTKGHTVVVLDNGKNEKDDVIVNAPETYIVYTVVSGDTLIGIAKRYEIKNWHSIYEFNHLVSTVIRPGQKLKIPVMYKEVTKYGNQ